MDADSQAFSSRFPRQPQGRQPYSRFRTLPIHRLLILWLATGNIMLYPENPERFQDENLTLLQIRKIRAEKGRVSRNHGKV